MRDMGQFRVTARLTGPAGDAEDVELLVDTGATLLTLPRSLADRLELRVRRHLRVVIAGGTEAIWPVADVILALEGNEVPTPCFIAPEGEALLGAVALESLFLMVDPVGRRLVPTKGYVLTA
jgi:predicted aspartyl protease